MYPQCHLLPAEGDMKKQTCGSGGDKTFLALSLGIWTTAEVGSPQLLTSQSEPKGPFQELTGKLWVYRRNPRYQTSS